MHRSSWWVGALASSLLAGGCARDIKEDQTALGRLPMDAQRDVFTAQHDVDVARANLTTAERAKDEVKQFQDVTGDDLTAAKARMEAARAAVDLAQQQHDDGAASSANASLDLAQRELVAARAKQDYARRLGDLRDAEVDLGHLQLDAAERQLQLARANTLERNGVRPREDPRSLRNDYDKTRSDLVAQQAKVRSLDGEVEQLRTAWDRRRQDFNVASRSVAPMPSVHEPRDPARVKPVPLPDRALTPSSDTPPPAPQEPPPSDARPM